MRPVAAEVTAQRPTCIGKQAMSTSATAPSFSLAYRSGTMFDVAKRGRTPGPADYRCASTSGCLAS
jgi:hypothetical protein